MRPPRRVPSPDSTTAPGGGRSLHSAAMDLHVIGPLASPAERAAVDAVLGPPESGWFGGARDARTDGHAARGGHATRARRSQLLPALHAVQSRIGWISTPALNYVCKRLAVAPAEAYGVATFYALFATTPRPPVVAHVCDDIACRLAGAERDLRRPDTGRRGRPANRSGTAARRGCAARASGCATGRRRRCSRAAGETPSDLGRSRRSMRPGSIGALEAGRRRLGAPTGPAPTASSSRPTGRTSSAGSASSTRPRSTTTGRTAGTRRSSARSRSAPTRSSPRSPRPS